MAAFPSFGQDLGSSEGGLDGGAVWERASNGGLRGRDMWGREPRTFSVQLTLSNADTETLRTFLATNRTLAFDFTWARDGQTYSVINKRPAQYQPLGGGWNRVRVELEQV